MIYTIFISVKGVLIIVTADEFIKKESTVCNSPYFLHPEIISFCKYQINNGINIRNTQQTIIPAAQTQITC